MTFKKYAIQSLFCTLLLGIAACSKYERNNPNDLLNGEGGTPNVVFDKYEVVSDNNNDGKFQKGETVVLGIMIKNIGSRPTEIKVVESVSKSPELIVNGFDIDATPISYVGKTSNIGQLRIRLGNDVKRGEIFTCEAKLTDTEGNIFNIQFNIVGSDYKPSVLTIIYGSIYGFEPIQLKTFPYSKGLFPGLFVRIKNNSGNNYRDDAVIRVTSLDASYPFEYSITTRLDIPGGILIEPGIMFDDCFTQSVPDNTILPVRLSIIDVNGSYSERDIMVNMGPDVAKIDFNEFSVVAGTAQPGGRASMSMGLTNSGARALKFDKSGINVSSTSSYLSSFRVDKHNTLPLYPEIVAKEFCNFSFAISPNCPKGIEIPINVELTSYEKCPTTFKTTINLKVD